MAYVIKISDLSDGRLAVFTSLTEAQIRNRLEEEKGVFIAEGLKVIRVALGAGYEPVSMLMPEKYISGQGAELIKILPDIPVYTAEEEILKSLTGYSLTRGMLCAFRRKIFKSAKEACAGARIIAVAENITDPSNLGAIIRSAAAFNVGAILFTPSCADPFNRRTVRVSMGTLLQIPFARIASSPNEWKREGIAILHSMGYKAAALALDNNAVSLSSPTLKSEEKLALILGTEGEGLCPETIKNSDYVVKIPMSHGVDSLNVAAAAAVAFWELTQK